MDHMIGFVFAIVVLAPLLGTFFVLSLIFGIRLLSGKRVLGIRLLSGKRTAWDQVWEALTTDDRKRCKQCSGSGVDPQSPWPWTNPCPACHGAGKS